MKTHSSRSKLPPFIFFEAVQMIETLRKEVRISIKHLCEDIHISTKSYNDMKTGKNMKMIYYWLTFIYLINYKYKHDEIKKDTYFVEFRKKIVIGIERNYPFILNF